MSDGILIINAGSSSIKFTVYVANAGLHCVTKGQLEGIGVGITPRFQAKDAAGAMIVDETWPAAGVGEQTKVLGALIDWIEDHLGDATLKAAGHRVVHGGPKYGAPVKVDRRVLADLESYVSLAPLHQPHNLAPIKAVAELHPDMPQVACFDTAFHMTKRPEATMFALPRRYMEQGVRRYGFHGLSYEFIAHKLKEVAPDIADGRVICAHLGSGASMCGMKNGKSVDSSMGFTAVDGLMMGTRTGTLDPGVVLHLMTHEGLDARAIQKLLYKESGLLGVSGGISNDMRVLLDSPAPAAKEAVDLFVYRICQEIGALSAATGGIDALVFTAGIGEHAAPVRASVVNAMSWLGMTLDEQANASDGPRITTADSPVAAYVVPTDEELMIAQHTRRLVL